MDKKLPWIAEISNGWRAELARRVAAGEVSDTAFADIVIRFLQKGDARPLIDAVQSEMSLPLIAQRYIGAMLDIPRARRLTTHPIHYEIRFWERQKPGLKSGDQPLPKPLIGFFRESYEVLDGLEIGISTNGSFWQKLAKLIVAGEGCGRFEPRLDWRKELGTYAVLKPLDPKVGKPVDLELEERDRLIADKVKNHMSNGACYDSAIRSVRDEIALQAKKEGWEGQLRLGTIKAAYGRWK